MDFKKIIKRVSSIQARQIIKNSKKPIIVQLFSHGCSACHDAEPHIQAAVNSNDEVEVIAVDGDFNMDFANEYGVDGYPTAVGFKNGQKIGAMEGSGDAKDYSKFFLRCARPKPLKKVKPVKANKPKPRPKPKPKPSRKTVVKPKKPAKTKAKDNG